MKAYILFHSNNYAIWASNVLKELALDHKMTSVPRHFSSDCGYCIELNSEIVQEARDHLVKSEIEFDRIEKEL